MSVKNAQDETPSNDGTPAPESGAPAESSTETIVKPEGLPDDLWDAEAKAPKVDALIERVKAAEEAAKGVVTDPKAIDWTIEVKDDAGVEYEFDKDDPAIQAYGAAMAEAGLTQKQISAVAAAYAKQEIANRQATIEALKGEFKKLGDTKEKVEARIAAATSYVESVVGKEKASAFASTWVTAHQIEVIEALAAHARGPNPGRGEPTPNDTNPVNPGRTFYSNMKKEAA